MVAGRGDRREGQGVLAGELDVGGMVAYAVWRGRLAQLARALPLQGRGHRFESCIAHFRKVSKTKYLRR